MKTIITAFNLFKKQFSSNSIIIIFFAIFCSISNYLYNQYDQRTECYEMFRNSPYNILYVNMPENFLFSQDKARYIELYKDIDAQAKDLDGYVGASTIINTYVKLKGASMNEEEYCSMYLIDETTSKALKYKIEQGRWLSDARIVNGLPPCIIGGDKSGKYKIGDMIKISFFKNKSVNGEYIQEEAQTSAYYIAGKFNEKQQFFNIQFSASSSPQPLSVYLSVLNTDIYIWAKHEFTYDQTEGMMNYSIQSSPLLYFEKTLPRESIDQVIKEISSVNLFSHLDLMAEEKVKIAEDYELILPIMAMLAIVSIVGIYSMCVLNVFRNYNMFAIFYLCGCSKRRNIMIIAAHSLFFMVFTLLLIGVIYCIFAYLVNFQDPYLSQYIYIDLKHVAAIVAACFSVSFLSFATPFALLKKMSIVKQLNVE